MKEWINVNINSLKQAIKYDGTKLETNSSIQNNYYYKEQRRQK